MKEGQTLPTLRENSTASALGKTWRGCFLFGIYFCFFLFSSLLFPLLIPRLFRLHLLSITFNLSISAEFVPNVVSCGGAFPVLSVL